MDIGATRLSRACALVACCWALLQDNEAAAAHAPGIDGPRGRQLHDTQSNVLSPIEFLQGTSAAEPRKGRVMDMINRFRAEICAKMHDENGEKFKTFEKCEDFMNGACKPGGDVSMDGDAQEVNTGKGYCHEYFPDAKTRAEAAIAEEDRKAKEKEEQEKQKEQKPPVLTDAQKAAPDPVEDGVNSLAKAIGAPPLTEPKEKKEAGAGAGDGAGGGGANGAGGAGGNGGAGGADRAGGAGATGAGGAGSGDSASDGSSAGVSGAPGAAGASGAAAAPGVAAAPGGAPSGAPSGAPAGPAYAAEDAWYYKDNGKNFKSRIGHMDEGRGLPTQGLRGKLVKHDDMKTFSGDWQKEWDHDSMGAYCAKHPDNPWCDGHHSGSVAVTPLAGLLMLSLTAVLGVF